MHDKPNHLNKMTDQLEYLRASANDDDTIRVAYATSGELTAAIIASTSAIVESTSYQTICQSKNEAYYLIAIINSNELAKRAKPLCPTNWAKEIRHFHKHGWKLPIPRYEASDPLHVQLSELGATAKQECLELIAQSDIMTKPPGDAQSAPPGACCATSGNPTAQPLRTSRPPSPSCSATQRRPRSPSGRCKQSKPAHKENHHGTISVPHLGNPM